MAADSEIFVALSTTFEADEVLKSAARTLIDSFHRQNSFKIGTKYTELCAFFVASRLLPAKFHLSLSQIWTSLPEIHINDFFSTLRVFLSISSLSESLQQELLSLQAEFTFGYTFYRKFEELWGSWVEDAPGYKEIAWMLFVVVRVNCGCLRDLTKTALVLIGVLKAVFKRIGTVHPPRQISFIGTLLLDNLDSTTYPHVQINHAVLQTQSFLDTSEVDFDALKSKLAELYAVTLSSDSVDERLFLRVKFITNVTSVVSTGVCPTPISQILEVNLWLAKCCETPISTLISSIANLENNEKIEAELNEFRRSLSENRELVLLSDHIITLYACLLLQIWENRQHAGLESDFKESYSSTNYRKCLLSLSIECVLYAKSITSVRFEDVLVLSGIKAFELWKLLVTIQVQVPRPLRTHFRMIETKIVCSLGWERAGPVDLFLRSLDRDVDETEEALPTPPPYKTFFQHVTAYLSRRLRQLSVYLHLNDQVRESAWKALKALMSEQTEIVIGRHLDQILLCVLYSCCQGNQTSWASIISAYEQENPEELSLVCRAVKTTSSELSLEDFHQKVIRPRLMEMRRLEGGSPRIADLCPSGPLPALPVTSPGPLPLKSPFRHAIMSPATQRLYTNTTVRPSDRRLDLDREEKELQEAPIYMEPVLNKPQGLHLPRLGPSS